MNTFVGIYLLIFSIPGFAEKTVEFSTYEDCVTAATLLATWAAVIEFEVSCVNKGTGEIHAFWGRGP